ncbi:MAG: cation diffusion facilitator family transporter [Candidatus Omnitrophota bacterium]
MKMNANEYMFRAVKVSLCGNIVLFSIKAATLIFVNSLAIAVDLGISFVALVVSVILFYSIKIANRPADLLHNYGYGKIEHVCEVMEGVILIGIALAMSSQAIMGILHPKHITSAWLGLTTSIIGVIINCVGGAYILIMAKKSFSPAIRAEALHYFLEGFISFAITSAFILTIVLQAKGQTELGSYVDPLAALLVSIIITIPSFKLAKHAFLKLLDASMEEEGKMEIVKQLAMHVDKYCEFKDLKTRTAGRKKFVELKIILPQVLSFKKGYEVAAFLENGIKNNIPNSEILIQIQPCRQDCEVIKQNKRCPYLSC